MRISGTDKKCLQNVQKVLDLCGFYGYYMSRYSGIVQSVEQRTVNPYVAGSSPAARAKISADFCGFFCIWSVLMFSNKTVSKLLEIAFYEL